jgi:hypothetical protein
VGEVTGSPEPKNQRTEEPESRSSASEWNSVQHDNACRWLRCDHRSVNYFAPGGAKNNLHKKIKYHAAAGYNHPAEA